MQLVAPVLLITANIPSVLFTRSKVFLQLSITQITKASAKNYFSKIILQLIPIFQVFLERGSDY